MTMPKHNLRSLTSTESSQGEHSGLAVWGFPAIIAILAALALTIVWLNGDVAGVSPVEARKTVTILILCVCIGLVIAHLMVLGSGADAFARQLFRRETGDGPKATRTLTRDSRLQYLYEELRTSHGWFWRYRMPWLMLSGSDELTAEVAPGLKQAGVLHIADAILVHATPDGIAPALWRKQIKQLRRRRPIDSLIHVERTGAAIRPDPERARTLAGIATDLGWAAPVTFLHAVPAKGTQPEQFDAVGAFTRGSARQSASHTAAGLKQQLTTLERQTAIAGVRILRDPERIIWLAQVSQYIDDQRERIVTGWETLIASKWLKAPLAGVMFAPIFPGADVVPVPIAADAAAAYEQPVTTGNATANTAADTATQPGTVITLHVQPASLLPTWQEIARRVRHHHGRRVGFYWSNALAILLTLAAMTWCVALTVSFIGNRRLIQDAQASVDAALAAAPGTPVALRSQLSLEQQIELFEYRQQHGAPWYLHAGLNRNDEILDGLWQPYQSVASRNLQRPVVQGLQSKLIQLSQVRADALQSHEAQRHGYHALKTYLMLAEPRRTDPAFLKQQIVATWPAPAAMSTGEWLDTSQRLAGFYADHLKAHSEWRINASEPIVTAARNTLVNQIGLANADDTLYQSIIDNAKGKYADASLMTLLAGTDAGGLFSTTQTVPGIYTRAAWDGMIADAIDKAVGERRVNGDWVLSSIPKEVSQDDDGAAQSVNAAITQGAVTTMAAIDGKRASDDVKQRLTARYFAEYTAAWQGMLNSIQWQPAANLSGAIDQLTRLADAQTSPLIALMKSVQYQAQAGRPSQALTDTLVRHAQSLLRSDDKTQTPVVNPLDKPFGPLLALMGDSGTGSGTNNGGNTTSNAPTTLNGVSLAHYLTVATTMRLKLQQIAASPTPSRCATCCAARSAPVRSIC
jgi:type VI secretion system protein ImpL